MKALLSLRYRELSIFLFMKLTRDTEELKNNKDFSVGDFVSWNSSGGRARGKITKKVTNGKVPDIDADITGTKDDPAYQIRVYRDGEPTDTLVGHKGGSLTKIEPIESDKSLDELDPEEIALREEDNKERDEVYSKYHSTVNMSASELEDWSENECSKKASVSRAPIKRNLELLRTKKEDWISKHIRWANRTISFVNRMKGNDAGEPAEDGCPSKKTISLKNWAFDPGKGSNKSMNNLDAIAQQVAKQGEAIESLRGAIEQSLKFQVTEALEDSDEDDDIIKTRIGPPDESQLVTIIKLTGVESTADQWTMVGVHASNNLLDRSGRRWGLRSLTLMGLDFIGRPLILNHSWEDAEASRGLIVSCALVKEDASVVPKEMLSGAGADEFNKEIIEKEGLHWLYMCVAIPNDSSAATAVKNRLMNDVSTGSILHSAYLRCPNCERESGGKEVRMDTYTIDKNGKKVFDCSHLAGSPFLRAVLGEEYDEYNFSDYVILDSQDVSSIELSLCQAGCLPKASILRS